MLYIQGEQCYTYKESNAVHTRTAMLYKDGNAIHTRRAMLYIQGEQCCTYKDGNVQESNAVHCYEIQYTWTARSTETETETGLDRYVMLGARWLTEY